MVFGGFGIMLYGGESPLLAFDKVIDKVDVQSMFFATMFMIIILVLGMSCSLIFMNEPLIIVSMPLSCLRSCSYSVYDLTLPAPVAPERHNRAPQPI